MVIAAALIALIQIDAAKAGKPSVIAVAAGASTLYVQTAVAAVSTAVRDAAAGIADAPRLASENQGLRANDRALRAQNARLSEALAQSPDAQAIARAIAAEPSGIEGTAIGYDPENVARQLTLDRGTDAGIHVDDGVVTGDGVVGRVVDATPFESTVLLVTDGASKVPAVVQRGRWWGIATGTNGRVRLEYVSQDAKLRVGDAVVTGEGRSFHAGLPIGRITRIDHPDGALYQSAVVEPAVEFGRISRVIVLPHGAAPATAATAQP